MADGKLVQLLKSTNGVAKFNAWREEHLVDTLDLGLADLHDLDLSGINFRNARLAGANLSGTNLGRSDLSGADLSATNLRGARLANADIARADLRHADLTGVRLGKTRGVGFALFSGARMDNRTSHIVLIKLEETFVGLRRL